MSRLPASMSVPGGRVAATGRSRPRHSVASEVGRRVILTVGDATVPAVSDGDRPRPVVTRVSAADRVFRGILYAAGITMLIITASILAFLVLRSVPTFQT